MIEEQATVTAVHGALAEVVTLRRSACGSCNAKGGCGTSLLATWFPQRTLRFRLANVIGANPGDTVLLGLDEGFLQRGSLLLYGLPLVGLLLGAVGGEWVFKTQGYPPELGAVSSGLLGLIAALMAVRHFSQNRAQGGRDDVRLLRVVRSSQAFSPSGRVVPLVDQPEVFRKVEP